MSREDRAVAIVELIAQTMGVIDEGERGEQALCHAIARATEAEAAVLLGADATRRIRVHAVYPNPRTAASLADAVVAGHGQPVSDHPALGDIRVFGPPLFGEATPDATARCLAISKRSGFATDARLLLGEVAPVLKLILPQVGAACQRAEQSRNATDAAAALNLTSREVEVLALLSEGLLARTIAARLGLSPRTVHKHLSNVYTKLGVHDRLVAVSFARERGLISS